MVKYPPLTAKQQKLVEDHTGLVFQVALPLVKRAPLDDLIAEGRLGLCLAAGKFDESRGLMFSTYAVYWVRARIYDYIMKNQSQVIFGTRREDRRVYFQLGRARRLIGDDLDAVAAYMGIDRQTLDEALPRVERTDVVLDVGKFVLKDERPGPLKQLLVNEASKIRRKRILKALRRLDPRERIVTEQRLLKAPAKPLRVLGEEFGVSRERVRQIELKAKEKLRVLLADVA